MNTLLQDVRYGVRLLLKRPAFTILVIVILALGTGANTAIFSVLNAVVLRPLPYEDPSRLYELGGKNVYGSTWISAPDFLTWQQRTQVFQQMAAVDYQDVLLTQVDEPEHLYGLGVSPECFPMLGVQPMLGRGFAADDYRAGAEPVVLIGHRLWQRRFGGDRAIVGRQIMLHGKSHTVIGVMPPLFAFGGGRHEFWRPLTFSARHLARRQWRALGVFARVKPGLTSRHAEAETQRMGQALSAEFPKEHEKWSTVVRPLRETAGTETRNTLLLLLGAVAFVMLIACFNVANLMLARASERTKEIAVRVALGASRGRLIRQLLTESVLLSLAGGGFGLLLAAWANRALTAFFTEKRALPRLGETSIDWRVLGFTLLLCMVCGVLFGLVPALRATRPDLNETLKETGRTGTASIRARRFRSLLIVAETALALVLLCGAGVMLRSFLRLLNVNPGFQAQNVLTMELPLPTFRVTDRKQYAAYYTPILQQVQTLPGVRSAALSTVIPLAGGEAIVNIGAEGTAPLPPGQDERIVPFSDVSADYFRTMSIPVLLGRAFTDADDAAAPHVAIVNEALARELWPGENPLGKQIQFNGPIAVVGVVANVKDTNLTAKPKGKLYRLYAQSVLLPESALVIRTAADPLTMLPAIKKKIREAQPDQVITDIRTLDRVVADSVSQPRLYTLLLGIFAGLALVLAAAGVYGVLSCSVTQRSQEMGIRMALGATRADILRLMMGHGAAWVLAGVAIGLAGAFAATRLLANLLYQVSPFDPATFVIVSALLLAVALVAIYLPSRRATKVDPLVALRYE